MRASAAASVFGRFWWWNRPTCSAFRGQRALMAGAALECVHCYSLVHDDLPAMDNDELRRGPADRAQEIRRSHGHSGRRRPADLRVRYPVAAGNPSRCRRSHRTGQRARARIRALAAWRAARCSISPPKAALTGNGPQRLGERDVLTLQAMKTGALLRFGCQAGGILAAAGPTQREALRALWLGGRPSLPDRGRSARCRGRPGAGRKIRPAKTPRPARPRWSSVLGGAGAKARLTRTGRGGRGGAGAVRCGGAQFSSRAPASWPIGTLEAAEKATWPEIISVHCCRGPKFLQLRPKMLRTDDALIRIEVLRGGALFAGLFRPSCNSTQE